MAMYFNLVHCESVEMEKYKKKVQKKGECMILWLVPPSLESSRHTNSIPFIIIALVMINLHKLLCPSGHVWLLQWIQILFVVPFKVLSKYIFTRYLPTLNFNRIKIISHRIEKKNNAVAACLSLRCRGSPIRLIQL